MRSRQLKDDIPDKEYVNLGEGLIATYQSELDYDMLAVMNKAGIERNGVDPMVKSTSCLRLTSDGVKEYGDLLPCFCNATDAIEAFTKEFLGYMVRGRMMDGKAIRELTWKKAPTLMYSVDGWSVVSWIVRDVWDESKADILADISQAKAMMRKPGL